jgi:hypothetical protein
VVNSLGISKSQKVWHLRETSYSFQMQTVIPACHYAAIGDLKALITIRDRTGFNFSMGDYDNRTPLHVACAFNQIEVV